MEYYLRMRVFIYLLLCFLIYPFNYKDYDILLNERDSAKLALELSRGINENPKLYFPMLTMVNLSIYDMKDSQKLSFIFRKEVKALLRIVRWRITGETVEERETLEGLKILPSKLAFLLPLMESISSRRFRFLLRRKCESSIAGFLGECDREVLLSRADKLFYTALKFGKPDDIIPAFELFVRKIEREENPEKLKEVCRKFSVSMKDMGLNFPLAFYYKNMAVYYRMVGNQPKMIEALEKGADAFLLIRDYRQAFSLLKKAGIAAEKVNNDFLAEALYKRALALSDKLVVFSPELVLSLSEIYLKKGKVKEALSMCRESLRRNMSVFHRVKFLHLLGLIMCRSSFLARFLAYRYMKEAYKLAIGFDESILPDMEKKYDFLREKASIIEDYSRAQMRLAEAVIVLLILLSGVGLGFYFLLSWAVERKSSLIGPYRIKSAIAKGGMGTVYKAKSLATGEEVALKVLRSELYTEQAAERFKRETLFLKKLNHPNIVRFVSSGQHGERIYFAMEFINGNTLQNIIEKVFPLSLETNFQIVYQILSGLGFIHSKGIVHRDIKPSNIMVVGGEKTLRGKKIPEGSIKLMDFGISKSEELFKITTTGEVMGTPYFMAPELISSGESDRRSDIYSFGVTFYWLLTGEIPFFHPELATVLYKIVTLTPLSPSKIRPGIPECLDEVILVCMEKDPEDRYQSVEELLEELHQCEDELKSL